MPNTPEDENLLAHGVMHTKTISRVHHQRRRCFLPDAEQILAHAADVLCSRQLQIARHLRGRERLIEMNFDIIFQLIGKIITFLGDLLFFTIGSGYKYRLASVSHC